MANEFGVTTNTEVLLYRIWKGLAADGSAGSASTSNVTSVASSATSATLLNANSSRVEAIITNDSTAILYVKLGGLVTTSSYSVSLSPSESLVVDKYNGSITGVWSAVNGNARITETS